MQQDDGFAPKGVAAITTYCMCAVGRVLNTALSNTFKCSYLQIDTRTIPDMLTDTFPRVLDVHTHVPSV